MKMMGIVLLFIVLICIAQGYRGQGIFPALYDAMRQRLLSLTKYDCIVTAVSTQNPRSLRAHAKVGFESIHQFVDHGHEWVILLWDIQKEASDEADDNEGE